MVAGSVLARTRARLFAPQAAEFLTLSPDQAHTAIESGLAELERVSLGKPSTFCAPAWLMPSEYKSLLRAAGISRYVGMFSLEDLDSGLRKHIPGFGYMGGPGLHELGIRSLNRITRAVAGHASTIKVYLHPDVTGRRGWQRTVQTLEPLIHRHDYRIETYCAIFDKVPGHFSA
jgi:predicted deacetylase